MKREYTDQEYQLAHKASEVEIQILENTFVDGCKVVRLSDSYKRHPKTTKILKIYSPSNNLEVHYEKNLIQKIYLTQ